MNTDSNKEKQNDRRKNNTDILGDKWYLAPRGRDTIDRCQTRIIEVRSELTGLGALFRNMASCDLDSNELWGIGVLLEKIGHRLTIVTEKLSSSMTKKENSSEK